MLGRIQTSGTLRGFRLVRPGCNAKIPAARMFSISSSQRLRPPPSLLGPSLKSRNIWGFSSAATNAPATSPPPPVVPATDPEPITSAVLTSDVPIVPTVDAASSIASDFPIPTDIPLLLQNVPSLNYGDLAALGFSHWTPAGLCQWGMELIQVSTGMPWFWAIVATTLFTRLIILPFNINSLRITARLAPFQPRLTELRAKMSEINNRDPIALQRISLQQKKIYEEAQVSMLQPLLVPALQLPLSLGMFFGVKRLCELPLQQLQVGGLSFLPDLTVADPTYLLPIAMAALINVQLSVGAKDMTTDGAQTLHLFNFFKVITFVTVPFMANLPAGVLVYLITGVVAMVAQSLVLRIPSVRKLFNIPLIPQKSRVKPPTFMESVRYGLDFMSQKNSAAQVQARKRKY